MCRYVPAQTGPNQTQMRDPTWIAADVSIAENPEVSPGDSNDSHKNQNSQNPRLENNDVAKAFGDNMLRVDFFQMLLDMMNNWFQYRRASVL